MHRLRDPSEGETGGDQSDDADDLLRWGFAYASLLNFQNFHELGRLFQLFLKE